MILTFAHRGLKLEYPENTIGAFEHAKELGFGIELDVRLTKDGQLVCIHNPNTQHVSGVSRDVCTSTLAELERLNCGARFYSEHPDIAPVPYTPIARFDDVARTVIPTLRPPQKAAIHVKYDEQGEDQFALLVRAFHQYDLYDKAFLFDLTLESAKLIRAVDPRIQLSLSVGEDRYSPTIYLWDDVRSAVDLFDIVWWDEWKIPGSVYNATLANKIHNAGKKIYAISPELHANHDHPHAATGYHEEWQTFVSCNVEGICTAYPKELKSFLGQ